MAPKPQGCIHSHYATGASNAALTFSPTADAEIQPYLGADSALLLESSTAISALATAAAGKTCVGTQIVQEPSYVFGQTVTAVDAPIPIAEQCDGLVATGIGSMYVQNAVINKQIPRDADMVVYAGGPGSDAVHHLIHALYGNAIYVDQLIGKRFFRMLEDANDCSGTAKEEFEQSPIVNLDPQRFYALLALGGVTEDAAAGIVTVEAPSFSGIAPKGLFASGYKLTRVFDPRNGRQLVFGIFSGAESVTVSFTGSATQKAGAILEIMELDNPFAIPPAGPRSGRMGGVGNTGPAVGGGLFSSAPLYG